MEKKKERHPGYSTKLPKYVDGPDGMTYEDHLRKYCKKTGKPFPKKKQTKVISKYDL